MEWKSNASYKKDPSEGTIFDSTHGVTIHRIIHCDGWFLTCRGLNIQQRKLSSETFDEAVKESKQIVKETLSDIQRKYVAFADDRSENVMVKHFSR